MITAPLPPHAPAGIYIHIPFCAHICPYCDFTTYAGKGDLIPAYVDAVCTEIALRAGELEGRLASTVYLGGGTPSLLDGPQIDAIVSACRDHVRLSSDVEISMEANPNGLTPEKLAGWRSAGMERLSIGAQTLHRRGLRTLGRQHEAVDVLASVAMARAAGFQRLNLDFIFGWPGQSRDSWRDDLARVLNLGDDGPDHLSLYSLIIEPGTPFADAQARGILNMPDDDATADLYEDAITILADAGWQHYEIANWSREPDGYSRHNAIYWQHGDYIGIGAGAFGTIGGMRQMNELLPERYIAALADGHLPLANVESLDETTARAETMMLGLRLLQDGVDADAFAVRHGVGLDDLYDAEVAQLLELGLLMRTDRGVRVTPRGMMLMNDVAEAFL